MNKNAYYYLGENTDRKSIIAEINPTAKTILYHACTLTTNIIAVNKCKLSKCNKDTLYKLCEKYNCPPSQLHECVDACDTALPAIEKLPINIIGIKNNKHDIYVNETTDLLPDNITWVVFDALKDTIIEANTLYANKHIPGNTERFIEIIKLLAENNEFIKQYEISRTCDDKTTYKMLVFINEIKTRIGYMKPDVEIDIHMLESEVSTEKHMLAFIVNDNYVSSMYFENITELNKNLNICNNILRTFSNKINCKYTICGNSQTIRIS